MSSHTLKLVSPRSAAIGPDLRTRRRSAARARAFKVTIDRAGLQGATKPFKRDRRSRGNTTSWLSGGTETDLSVISTSSGGAVQADGGAGFVASCGPRCPQIGTLSRFKSTRLVLRVTGTGVGYGGMQVVMDVAGAVEEGTGGVTARARP